MQKEAGNWFIKIGNIGKTWLNIDKERDGIKEGHLIFKGRNLMKTEGKGTRDQENHIRKLRK